jgi:hypothetical protein
VAKRVVKMVLDGEVEVAVSQLIIDETRRILKNKSHTQRVLRGALIVTTRRW